jgi:hypothetical protein
MFLPIIFKPPPLFRVKGLKEVIMRGKIGRLEDGNLIVPEFLKIQRPEGVV